MSTRLTALAAGVLLVAGCSGIATPTPTPGGFTDVVSQLVLRGVTIHEHVAGDDGCTSVELHDNAARLNVSVAGEPGRSDLHLFRWRRASDYSAAANEFFFCVGDFRAQHPGGEVDVVENAPWRAYGAGWSPQLEAAVRQALDAVV